MAGKDLAARTFVGDEGDFSTLADGPAALQKDINNLIAKFDPDGTVDLGSGVTAAGGVKGENMQAATVTSREIADDAVTDTEIGNRTADPTQVPTGLIGKLTDWVSWFTNRIKAITGTVNWYDAVPTTLTAAKSHIDAASPHSGHATVANLNAHTGAAAPHSGHETPAGAQAKVNTHNATSTSVHGIGASSQVVGTADAQSLSNKSLASNLDAGGNKVINLGTPSSPSDSASKGYVDGKVAKTGDTMSGDLVLDNNVAIQGKNSVGSAGDLISRASDDKTYVGDNTFNGDVVLQTHSGELHFKVDATTNTVWHSGNDGSGSGLDADTLDGTQLSGLIAKTLLATKGDMLFASGANTPAPLAIGTTGQRLVTDPTGVPVWADDIGKNYIIDGGNFEVAQAVPTVGTEITAPATGTYPVFDLWQLVLAADGGTFPTVKHSQKELTLGNIWGSKYYYNVNVNGAGSGFGPGSYYAIRHHCEHGTQNLCGLNKTVTLSFLAKSTIAGKKIGVRAVQNYGTSGSPSSNDVLTGGNWTLTSSWTKYTVTFATATLVGKTFGTNGNDRLTIEFYHQWGTATASSVGAVSAEDFVGSGDIQIAQVKLEPGSVATPYAPPTFAEALRACQRQYCKSYSYSSAPGTNTIAGTTGFHTRVAVAGNASGTLIPPRVQFPRTMRTIPTVSLYSSDGTAAAIRAAGIGARTGAIVGASYLGDNGFDGIELDNTSSVAIAADQLLYFHWIADARF